MMANQLQIGPQPANDQQVVNARGDNYGNATVQQFNGRYAEMVRRGQVFMYSTPAQAILTAGNGNPTLWNPSNSGKICYILQLAVDWISGTTTAGSVLIAGLSNTGPVIGTGLPIITFTNVAPINCLFGSSLTSSMKWAPTTSTFTTAPTVVGGIGVNLGANPTGIFLQNDYNSIFCLMPGTALQLSYSVATSTALYILSAVCAEMTIPIGTI